MNAREKGPELKTPLGDLLDDEGLDAESLERARRRMAATRRVAPAKRRPMALAAAAALLLAGLTTYVAWPRGASGGPLEVETGGPLASIDSEVRLSDGSTITPDGAVALEVVENTGERMVLVQGNGRVAYHVTPGGPRRWSVDAGAVTVDVVGTRFVVERDDAAVRLSVQRGHVRVRGEAVPGGVRSLGRGEALEVPVAPVAARALARASGESPAAAGADTAAPAADSATPASADTVAPGVDPAAPGADPAARASADSAAPAVEPLEALAASGPVISASDRAPAPDRAAAAATRGWLALARASDHAGAFRLLGPDGFRRATDDARTVEELLLLADVARAGGHPALAVDPLRAILDDHAAHPQAAWAALTLGRLQLDRLNRPAEAVASLERALDLGLPPRLRETALARLIDAHHRAGQPGRAILLRAQYENDFPNGRYVAPIEDEPR